MADDGNSIFVTLELDASTGTLKAVFNSAQDETQYSLVKDKLDRICQLLNGTPEPRPSKFGWLWGRRGNLSHG